MYPAVIMNTCQLCICYNPSTITVQYQQTMVKLLDHRCIIMIFFSGTINLKHQLETRLAKPARQSTSSCLL